MDHGRAFPELGYIPLAWRRGPACLAVVIGSFLWAEAASAAFEAPGVGPASGGVGIVVTNLDADPRPDIILMGNDDPSGSEGRFRYRVGWNLDADGKAAKWSPAFFAVRGSGKNRAGGAVAITNLDGDSRPELILMDYEAVAGRNVFRYTIGRNLTSCGEAAGWDTFVKVGDAGPPGTGVSLVITNIDDNPRPEMLILLFDSTNTRLRYKIGWNLDEDGHAARWGDAVVVDGIGYQNSHGPAAVIMNLDDDPRPELVIMTNDTQRGQLHFNIGWNIDPTGNAERWTADLPPTSNLGAAQAVGAGLATANLDGDPSPDLIVMTYATAGETPAFRYDVLHDTGRAQRIRLEMDKLQTVNWPVPSVMRAGSTYTLASIYARLGIDLITQQDKGTIPDLHPGNCYSDAELHGLLTAHMNRPTTDPDAWHMYAVLVSCSTHDSGTLGTMFDDGERRGFAVFMDRFKDYLEPERSQKVLRTLAHELGHALCLFHEDGDAMRENGRQAELGRTVMNQTWVLGDDWGYAWYAPEYHRIYSYGKNFWRPGSGLSFEACHP